jgi:hypothetical protein
VFAFLCRQGLVGAAGGSPQVAAAIEHFFADSVVPADPLRDTSSAAAILSTGSNGSSLSPSALLRIVGVVSPVLRQAPPSRHLQSLSARWLSAVSRLPRPVPSSSDAPVEELSRAGADLGRWCACVRVALAALPLQPSEGGTPTTGKPPARTLLLLLMSPRLSSTPPQLSLIALLTFSTPSAPSRIRPALWYIRASCYLFHFYIHELNRRFAAF